MTKDHHHRSLVGFTMLALPQLSRAFLSPNRNRSPVCTLTPLFIVIVRNHAHLSINDLSGIRSASTPAALESPLLSLTTASINSTSTVIGNLPASTARSSPFRIALHGCKKSGSLDFTLPLCSSGNGRRVALHARPRTAIPCFKPFPTASCFGVLGFRLFFARSP